MVGLFVPMTAAIYWKRANEWGAVASMLSGLLSWIALEYWNQNVAEILLPAELMAAGGSLLVLVIISFTTVHKNPPKPSVNVDGQQIEMTERLGILGFPKSARRQ